MMVSHLNPRMWVIRSDQRFTKRGMAVQLASTYIHALDGRLRIKVTGVKGAPRRALEIEDELQAIDGVDHVKANPTTGNILIVYRPDKIGQHEVVSALHGLGCLQEHDRAQMLAGSYSGGIAEGFSGMLAETLVRSTMELALQRLVSALI
jgi:copper chaperone CopZ